MGYKILLREEQEQAASRSSNIATVVDVGNPGIGRYTRWRL